jgi:hypothetical protein
MAVPSNALKKTKRAAPKPPSMKTKGILMTSPPQKILANDPEVPSLVRELYSRLPETRRLEPWELQYVLWSLNYCEDLIPEAEIAAAIEVARSDFDPDEGAA